MTYCTFFVLLALRCAFATVVIEMPAFDHQSKLTLNEPIKMSSTVTICVRFVIKSSLNKKFMLLSDEAERLRLTLNFLTQSGHVAIDGKEKIFQIPVQDSVVPYSWYHLCLSIDHANLLVVTEGQVWYQSDDNDLVSNTLIKTFLIGHKASPSKRTSNLKGAFSELNIWSKSLTQEDLQEITTNCGPLSSSTVPDTLHWASDVTSTMIYGNVTNQKEVDVCFHSDDAANQIIPLRVTFQEADTLCKQLNAYLDFPPDETSMITDMCFNYFWTPLQKVNQSWIDQTTAKQESDLAWAPDQPNGGELQRCATQSNGLYSDDFCHGSNCFACSWTKTPRFYLRGFDICKDGHSIDHQFILLTSESYNGFFIFKGFKNHFIIYQSLIESWVLAESEMLPKKGQALSNIKAVYKPGDDNPFPTGSKWWSVKTSDCPEGEILLKLTHVSLHFFHAT